MTEDVEVWTASDEAAFRPLKRKYDRIHKRGNRDMPRQRPYKPRLDKRKRSSSENQGEKK